MPSTSISKNAGVGPSAFTLRLPVEKGRLKSACISQISGDPTLGGLNAVMTLATEPANPETIIAVLAAGVFTEYQPIGWTGDIELEAGWTVYARLRTIGQCDVKLAIVTEI